MARTETTASTMNQLQRQYINGAAFGRLEIKNISKAHTWDRMKRNLRYLDPVYNVQYNAACCILTQCYR